MIDARKPKLPDIDLLNEIHQFPLMFLFKAIGDYHDEFTADILNQAIQAVGPSRAMEHSTRMSSKGNHVSVSLSVMCHTAHEVHGVYECLLKVRGLRALF
jgi:putative lipoic acid-binding regulatory protein